MDIDEVCRILGIPSDPEEMMHEYLNMEGELETAADQISVLSGACRFYADRKNWNAQACEDRGSKARSALSDATALTGTVKWSEERVAPPG